MKQTVQPSFVIAVGLALLAITQMDSYVDRLLKKFVNPTASLPDALPPILAAIGLVIVLIGLLWGVFPAQVLQGLTSDYQCLTAKREDLVNIHKMAREHFGDGVSSVATMKRWHNKNPKLFSTLYRVQVKGYRQVSEMVGYFCAIPLTKLGAGRISSGEQLVVNLLPEDIEGPDAPCTAIYIGAIVGTTGRARANILLLFHREITEHLSTRTNQFFTRPVTPDGLRIVKKYKFLPAEINPHGGVDALYSLKLDT